MSIVSANIQFGRGEHLLLDVTSYQAKYSDALAWAKDQYSNAAVGQYIYIAEDEVIDDVTYAKGPYIVEVIGENAVLNPLAKSLAGSSDLESVVSGLSADMSNVKTALGTQATDDKEATGIYADLDDLSSDIDNIKTAIGSRPAEGEASGIYKELDTLSDKIDNIDVPAYSVTTKATPNAGAAVTYQLTIDGTPTGKDIDVPDAPVKGIKVDNADVTPDANGIVSITLPDVPEYTIESITPESDAAATYQLKKGDSFIGAKINIPKDMVVSSGEVRKPTEDECTTDATLDSTALYIVLTLANSDNSKLFIKATDLIDIYTGSTYITVENNTVSLKLTELVAELEKTFYTEKEIDTKLDDYATSDDLSTAIGSKSTFGDDAKEGSGLLKEISDVDHKVDLLDAATIKGIKVDGNDVTADDSGIVSITLPDVPAYSVTTKATPNAGAAVTYQLTIDGTPTGKDIDVPDAPVKGIKVDGEAVEPENGIVSITLPDVPEYSVTTKDTPNAGAAVTYQLTIDGVATGKDIDVPSAPVKDVTYNDESLLTDGKVDLSGFATTEELIKKGVEEETGNETWEGLLDERYVLTAAYITEAELLAILK